MTSAPKLLVTGAGGAIGRRLRKRLDSDTIDGTYIESSGSAEVREDPFTDIADITDSVRLSDILENRRPNVIIHLASMSGAACEADPERAFAVNVEAVQSLAEIAQRYAVSRLVFASTSAVYGDQYDSPISETADTVLSSQYAKTKRQAEINLSAEVQRSTGFAAVAMRIFNVYGPGMRGSLANRLVNATASSPVELAGLDTFIRDYVHVDDVVEALVRGALVPLASRWLIANVGSGRPMSNRSLVEALQPVHFTTTEPRASYSCADTSAAQRALGFTARRELSRASLI